MWLLTFLPQDGRSTVLKIMKEKVWMHILNTHNTTIKLAKNILTRFEKKANFWDQSRHKFCQDFI